MERKGSLSPFFFAVRESKIRGFSEVMRNQGDEVAGGVEVSEELKDPFGGVAKEEAMEEENVVTKFLGDLLRANPTFHYKGKFHGLCGKDTPPRAVLLFVREQIKALGEEIKKAQG